jgi:hypothetical protein
LSKRRIPVVVFTGAGASRAEPISLPTMTEFFQEIMSKDRVPITPRVTDSRYFKFIFDTLYGDSNNYDLERIMGALYGLSGFTDDDCWGVFQNPVIYDNIIKGIMTEFNQIRRSRDGGMLSITDATSNLKNLVKQAVSETYDGYKESAKQMIFDMEWLIREKYEDIPNEHIRQVYEPFFTMLIKNVIESGKEVAPIVPFFTTNYDMSIDWFFEPRHDNDITTQTKWEQQFKKEITFIDGFDRRGWTINEYKKINEKNEGAVYVPYFKLHGSLFWEKVAGRVKMGTNVANDPYSPKDLMLVYPSDKKILHEDPYYFNQRNLELYLKRTDTLIIIGFSFRDPAIVSTFNSALLDNEELNIVVVAPDFDVDNFPEMDRFLKQDRAHHIIEYFGTEEAINSIYQFLNNEKNENKNDKNKNDIAITR